MLNLSRLPYGCQCCALAVAQHCPSPCTRTFNFREIFKRAIKIYGIWPQAKKYVTNTLPVPLVWGSLRLATIIQRPEEALDIQSELIFVNVMVHLPYEQNTSTPITLPLPATPPSSLTATPEAIFRLCDVIRSIYPRIKSLRVLSALPCIGLVLRT